jgi:hypothetical protein
MKNRLLLSSYWTEMSQKSVSELKVIAKKKYIYLVALYGSRNDSGGLAV